jgi:predicted ferric reductase
MKRNTELDTDSPLSFFHLLLLFGGAVAGAWMAAIVLPIVLPDLAASLFSSQPTAYWYLARSSAWAAYGLLWASMMLGLIMTSKTARTWPGGSEAFDLHHFTSLLGFAIAVFHGLIVAGDRFLSASIGQILTPFSFSAYRPEWIGIGQISMYIFAILCLSFYVRRWITLRGWRLLHFLSFLTFAGVLLHGVMSGTDSPNPMAIMVYAITGGTVILGIVYRIFVAATAPARRIRRAGTNIQHSSLSSPVGRVQSDPS